MQAKVVRPLVLSCTGIEADRQPSPLQTSTAIMDDVAGSSAALKTLNAALEAPPASSAAKSSQNGPRQLSPTEIVAQKLQVW